MDHPRKSGASLPLHVVGSTVPTEQALNLQSLSGTWSTPVFSEDPPAVRTSSPRMGCSVQMMELLDSWTSAPEDHVEESGCCPDGVAGLPSSCPPGAKAGPTSLRGGEFLGLTARPIASAIDYNHLQLVVTVGEEAGHRATGAVTREAGLLSLLRHP